MDKEKPGTQREDPTAAQRKRDHIALAMEAQVMQADERFNYEPLLSVHPDTGDRPPMGFLGKWMRAPIWVSSMTGGTEWAGTINRNLAEACGRYGLGMGLGSCRQLLGSDAELPDFAVRKYMGDDTPLFANLGIAQLEEIFAEGRGAVVRELVDRLEADGLIVHINPFQEWLQPEGDRYREVPLNTVKRCLDLGLKIVVKEVGQGFGPQSVEALMRLPIAALDFGALGGTNFALLEMMRDDREVLDDFAPLARIGHTAEEMVQFVNHCVEKLGSELQCRQVIVSGGVRNFLDGYYYLEKIKLPAVYGQASGFLKHARVSQEALFEYIERQIAGLRLAQRYLTIKA